MKIEQKSVLLYIFHEVCTILIMTTFCEKMKQKTILVCHFFLNLETKKIFFANFSKIADKYLINK